MTFLANKNLYFYSPLSDSSSQAPIRHRIEPVGEHMIAHCARYAHAPTGHSGSPTLGDTMSIEVPHDTIRFRLSKIRSQWVDVRDYSSVTRVNIRYSKRHTLSGVSLACSTAYRAERTARASFTCIRNLLPSQMDFGRGRANISIA